MVVRFSEPLRPQFRIINRTGHPLGLCQAGFVAESPNPIPSFSGSLNRLINSIQCTSWSGWSGVRHEDKDAKYYEVQQSTTAKVRI